MASTLKNFGRNLFKSTSPEDIVAARQKAKELIDQNSVVVFGKSYCPYCLATKTLLKRKHADYFLVNLDQVEDGAALQTALEEITGQHTVPNIFIARKHIGGNSEIQSMSGQLDDLLQRAGALKA